MKLNNNGTIQWQKSLGGTDTEAARAIQQTDDGGYIVSGYSNSNDNDVSGNHGGMDFWIVKLDNTGTIQWQKSLGGSGNDLSYSIQQTNDGGYISAGLSTSNDGDVSGNHGGNDYWIVKIDNGGVIQWQKSLGGTATDNANSIQQTSDNGYIIAGVTSSNDGDVTINNGGADYWVVKLDNNGIIQWQKSLGGTGGENAFEVQQTNDNEYIIAGYSGSNDGDVTGHHGTSSILDYWVVKLDNTGTIQWEQSYGGTDQDYGSGIQQTSDNGYVVTGYSQSTDGDITGNHNSRDYWLLKLNNLGGIQWQKSIGGTSGDDAFNTKQTSDGGYIVAGSSFSNDGDVTGHHGATNTYDYWVVKLEG